MKSLLVVSFLFLGQVCNIEVAMTPVEMATGLMYRKEWAPDVQGMIFVHGQPQRVAYWMKNTYLNLTMLFLDKDYNVLEIHHAQPLDETPIQSMSAEVSYVLELNPAFETHILKYWNEFSRLLKDKLETLITDNRKIS